MKTDFKQISDRDLVALLLRNDHDAWTYVLMTVAMRIVRQRKYSEMLLRTSHPLEEAISKLCERLYMDDFALLREFRFEGSFDGWLGRVVRSVVQSVTGLTGKENQDREILADIQDTNSAFSQAEQTASFVEINARIMDKRESFVRFWRENQESAFIVLMKNELQMPMENIGMLLNRPANTIVQKAKRAQARLDELESE